MPCKNSVIHEGGQLVFKSRFQSVNNLAIHYLKTYHHMNCHNKFITNMYLLPHCSLPWKVDKLTEILPDIMNLMIIDTLHKSHPGPDQYDTNLFIFHFIASFHLFPGLQNQLFLRDLPTKIGHVVLILYVFFLSNLDLYTLTMVNGQYTFWNPSLLM
jgi:hypothetical protein